MLKSYARQLLLNYFFKGTSALHSVFSVCRSCQHPHVSWKSNRVVHITVWPWALTQHCLSTQIAQPLLWFCLVLICLDNAQLWIRISNYQDCLQYIIQSQLPCLVQRIKEFSCTEILSSILLSIGLREWLTPCFGFKHRFSSCKHLLVVLLLVSSENYLLVLNFDFLQITWIFIRGGF